MTKVVSGEADKVDGITDGADGAVVGGEGHSLSPFCRICRLMGYRCEGIRVVVVRGCCGAAVQRDDMKVGEKV